MWRLCFSISHPNTSVGSRDVPGWSRPAGRAGHVGRGRVKIFVDALGRVGLIILVINFCLLEDLCIHSESKLFHHVNSAFQISMSHNVLFCCSLCIRSVHVVFPRLYISDHKFSSVENVNSVLLKFDLLASLWAGRVRLGHCFACDQWIGWCRVGTLAGRVGFIENRPMDITGRVLDPFTHTSAVLVLSMATPYYYYY